MQYGLDTATGLITDYDKLYAWPEHKPKMTVAGFSAYSKTLISACAIADKVGALLFVDMAHACWAGRRRPLPEPDPPADVAAHHHPQDPVHRGGPTLARANGENEKKLNSAVFPAPRAARRSRPRCASRKRCRASRTTRRRW